MTVSVPALPGEGRAVAAWPAAGFFAATVLASLFFRLFPEVDLAVSALFYAEGTGFFLAADPLLTLLRNINLVLPHVCVLCALAALLVRSVVRRSRLAALMPPPGHCLFLLCVMGLGPGLLTRVIKDGFGRARPRETLEFGGDSAFSLPWDLSRACLDNCSFISGESASAAALLSLPLLLPAGRRPMAYAVIAPFAVTVSLSRVAFGAHFLSDVVIAWGVVLTLTSLLWRLQVLTFPHRNTINGGA